MPPKPPQPRVSLALALALCACLSGCALLAPTPKPAEPANPALGEIPSAQSARDSIVIGKSNKSDVLASLGKASVIHFDSGYEVWVYSQKSPEKPPAGTFPAKTELVFLLSPSGVVTKTRIVLQ